MKRSRSAFFRAGIGFLSGLGLLAAFWGGRSGAVPPREERKDRPFQGVKAADRAVRRPEELL